MSKKSKRLHPAWALLVLAALAGVGGLGWHWATTIRCRQIDLTGARHAERQALLALARVDTGMVLSGIDPRLVADRMLRHPWVASARATRLPTGTLALAVEERTPVALVVDAAGEPARYLDRGGHAMPLVVDAAYDVPILRGVKAAPPGKPVEHPTVRALLEALATADAETDALISEVEVRPTGEAWLYTVPAGANPTLAVRLGRDGFGPRLAKLKAFWHQAVLTRPGQRYHLVDLRFDSQVVTQEAPAPPIAEAEADRSTHQEIR